MALLKVRCGFDTPKTTDNWMKMRRGRGRMQTGSLSSLPVIFIEQAFVFAKHFSGVCSIFMFLCNKTPLLKGTTFRPIVSRKWRSHAGGKRNGQSFYFDKWRGGN
jgi:hypothetical protein